MIGSSWGVRATILRNRRIDIRLHKRQKIQGGAALRRPVSGGVAPAQAAPVVTSRLVT